MVVVQLYKNKFGYFTNFTYIYYNRCKMKKINMIGLKSGLLTVIEENPTRGGKNKTHIYYDCLCECGNTHTVMGGHLRRGNITHCGCKLRRGADHPLWEGVGEISGDIWYNKVVRSANGSKLNNRIRKPKELSIDIQYAWNLFLKQNRKCALSGLDLFFEKKLNDKSGNASLDRIDSSKGYIEGNVQWVHKDVNIMKNKFDNEYFVNICKLIAGGACEIPNMNIK